MVFLGCGNVTARHSRLLRKKRDVRLYYASRSPEKAKQYAARFKGAGYFGDYESALQSREVDVVFVATPPDSHLNLTLQAVRSGKHVIVEKPPFFKSNDFDLVAGEMARHGVQVLVAENYFYKPLRRKLSEILRSGVIGEIRFLYFNAAKTQKTADWRDDMALAGGGALFEGGIHWVNFITNLGLSVESVAGYRPGSANVKSPERSMQVVMKFADGPVGTLLYSWEISALINGLRLSRIYGTAGSITFESNGIFIFVRGKKWRFILPGFSDIGGFNAMFEDFFRALRHGEPPTFHLDLAKRDVEIIEMVYGSCAQVLNEG